MSRSFTLLLLWKCPNFCTKVRAPSIWDMPQFGQFHLSNIHLIECPRARGVKMFMNFELKIVAKDTVVLLFRVRNHSLILISSLNLILFSSLTFNIFLPVSVFFCFFILLLWELIFSFPISRRPERKPMKESVWVCMYEREKMSNSKRKTSENW